MSMYTRFCLIIGFYCLIPSEANCGNTFSGNKASNCSNLESSTIASYGRAVDCTCPHERTHHLYKNVQSRSDKSRVYYKHFKAEFRAVFATEIPIIINANNNSHLDKQIIQCNVCGLMHDSSIKHNQDTSHSSTGKPCPPNNEAMNQGERHYDPNCQECQEEMRQNAAKQQQKYQPSWSHYQWNQAPRAEEVQKLNNAMYCDKCGCRKDHFARKPFAMSTGSPDMMYTRMSEASDILRRVNNVILYGATVPAQADVINYVLDLLNANLQDNLTRSDVEYIKIFYPRRNLIHSPARAPPVCIRFHSFERKRQLLAKRHLLEDTPYKICNDLTPRQVTERRVLTKVCDALRALDGYERSAVVDDRFLMVNDREYMPADLAPLLESLRLPMVLLSDLYLD